jgi:hypothetical protein
MAKSLNEAESATLRLTLSKQSVDLLSQLAARGIHGRNAAEVAARMVDRALEEYIEIPKLRIGGGRDGD